MFANSIVQSAQPIVSFAHGRANSERLKQSKRLMLRWAVGAGAALSVAMYVLTPYLTRLFLSPTHEAYAICVEGFPYFITGVLFSSLNIVLIGYLQSVEQSALATIYTCLRGIVIVIPCFLLLPRWMGIAGIWMAIPLAEFITFIIIVLNSLFIKRQSK